MKRSANRIEIHVVVETPAANTVDLLHHASGLSKGHVKTAMNKGAVWLTRGKKTQRLRRVTRRLCAGDEVHLYYDPEVLAETPVAPTLIADVGGYSVWNKPYSLRSQGTKWGDHCTVPRWAERHLRPERPAFVVHRLDRAANGLILVAHSRSMAAALSSLFRERNIEKRYRAWVAGDFSGQSSPLRVEMPIDGRQAISDITFVRHEQGRSLLDVCTKTGRKHQVRRHLAASGFPIIGDRRYGGAADDDVDLQLTAHFLAFLCPVAGAPVEYRLNDVLTAEA